MDMAQNILVIRTVSGMAMAVATAIDSLEFSEVVGTIAGDDTIMMVLHEQATEHEVRNFLALIIPNIA